MKIEYDREEIREIVKAHALNIIKENEADGKDVSVSGTGCGTIVIEIVPPSEKTE